MATVLLVEDRPDLGLFEAGLLEDAGHRVLRCAGSPPYGVCPVMEGAACRLATHADVLLLSLSMIAPLRGLHFNGADLVRAYREHPDYRDIPMIVVSATPIRKVGHAPFKFLGKGSPPAAIVATIEETLKTSQRS